MSLWTKLTQNVTVKMKNQLTFAALSMNSMAFYLLPTKTAELR